MRLRLISCVAVLWFAIPSAYPETPGQLIADPAIKKAMDFAKENEPKIIEEQIKICEIPAPFFKETERGKYLAEVFKRLNLQNVRIDAAGNVLGERPGKAAKPHLVMAAHLDTVFPPGTDVHVKREGTVLHGPGIGDDCRGLATLIGLVEALNYANITTPGSITFVANVGEEGLGDLRGVKELFATTLKGKIDEFVSIEPGSIDRITNAGVGSYRYRVTYSGPGGHSYGAFGIANPVHALGRAIAKISDFQVPKDPKTTFNVGVIGGGTSVNSIAAEAWAEVDERSVDPKALDELDAKFKAAVQQALDEENTRWGGKGKIAVDIKRVGYRPAGKISTDAPIVQTALAVAKALGINGTSFSASSTDSNVPFNLSIPAITIGGGGDAKGAHSADESIDVANSWLGTQHALLLAVSLVQ